MTEESHLYPLKFNPIFQEKVWGGTKLSQYLDKDAKGNIGESWELSGVDGFTSIVQNGVHKGKDLNQLIGIFKEQLVGKKVYLTYGKTFPLLFKFIDAKEDLSVQLHPNDTLASKLHNSFGKTEMWYILYTEEDARLVLGFNRKMDEQTYLKFLEEKRIVEILHSEKVTKGDSFFIAPGTVHAIGAGVMLTEIQQTSDITYRIYDYDRPGLDGMMRELHNDLALKAINYQNPETRLTYSNNKNDPCLICRSPYFETNKLQLTKKYTRDLSTIDSFVVYMCIDGEGELIMNGHTEKIKKGDTILIPADTIMLNIKTQSVSFLEVYIP